MNVRSFLKAGHTPSLFCAFLYFDISFMVWVLLGALANSIVPKLELDEAQRGLMIALPILGGAGLRIILGLLTDRIGAKATGTLGLVLTVVPLLLGWLWADTYERILVVGVLLGVAGASFAAALPLASRWYPPQYQGLAMGLAGAGNSGTALATFFGPILAAAPGGERHAQAAERDHEERRHEREREQHLEEGEAARARRRCGWRHRVTAFSIEARSVTSSTWLRSPQPTRTAIR